MKKSTFILTFILLIIAIAGIFVAMRDQYYCASDILENANFNVANPTVTVHKIDVDNKDIFTEMKIPPKTQQKLIVAFQNAKFEKTTANPLDYNYRINMTLNTGYVMFVDSHKKLLTITSTNGDYKDYTMSNDSDFFTILEQVTK